MADLPTKESLEETKINMDTVDEYVNSDQTTLTDQYGNNRRTMKGIDELTQGITPTIVVTDFPASPIANTLYIKVVS